MLQPRPPFRGEIERALRQSDRLSPKSLTEPSRATVDYPLPGAVAVLVVFDTRHDLAPALRSVLQALAHVVVVDNSADGHPALAPWRTEARITLIHQRNRGGLAGAYNAAIQALAAQAQPPTHVVFIDDDSDASVLPHFLADAAVQAKLADPGTAAVAPAHRDRATALRARHIVLKRWRWHHLPREAPGLQRVAFVINSMSLWRMAALQRIGAYNEWLGVDHIDTEYCLRAQRLGLAVYLHGDFEFAQSIGQRHAYRLLGRTLQSGGHSSARRYLIARNTCRLSRAWLLREPAFAALCLARLGYEAIGIVLAERQRLSKLGALVRGGLAGLFARN